MSLLEPIVPTLLSVRRLPAADPALLAAYGADPARHTSLGLVTCDQDDALYVALDEATKHAAVDVVFARSFYAGSGPRLGPLSGEILGVLAAAEPQSIEDGLAAVTACLAHDACFYDADGKPRRDRVPARDRLARPLPGAARRACRSARPWPTWWRRRSRPRSASTPRSRPPTCAR
jgi:ethanolamine utilization microcompartment shell protein EutL